MRKPPDLVALGAALKAARARVNLTQEKLAERSGLHITYIAGIEAGLRNPSFRSLTKLASGLGITTSDLLDGLP